MSDPNRRHYDDTANQRCDVLGWDIVEQQAREESAAFDLRQHPDRQRAFFAHVIESVGGLNPFCTAYRVSPEAISRWVYQGGSR